MKIKSNRSEKKQRDMHRDLQNSVKKTAKLIDSSIKPIDAKLETKVNRFFEHTSPDKGKTSSQKRCTLYHIGFYEDLCRQHFDALPLKMER
jgi:hypothetical protein